MEEAYSNLSSAVEQQGYTLAVETVRGDPPYSKIFIKFLLSEGTFFRGTTSNNASEEALSKFWLNRCWRRRFSTNRNLFSWIERTRKVVKFAYGTRCYSVHWTCFLLPLTITVDSTFVAGHATKVTATRLLFYVVPVHGTSRKITKEFHGGNLTGSAVKTNGREGIRESGSSRGCPEVGLANDSWELSTQNK